MERLRCLFELYDEGFDAARWGGFETALWNLTAALRALDVEAELFTTREFPGDAALQERVVRGRVDALFPLSDRPAFSRPDEARHPQLVARTVRIWHDVRPLSHAYDSPAPCPLHDGRGAGPCAAEPLLPASRAANVFLNDDGWTHCFAHRHYIPWSLAHVENLEVRDREGPALVLAGKADPELLDDLLRRLVEWTPVRVIFSSWAGKRNALTRARLGWLSSHPRAEVVASYDIRRDARRVFGGVACLLVVSRLFETFDFLSGEAAALGLPVLRLGPPEAPARFTSLHTQSADELLRVIATGEHRSLTPSETPKRSWRDVAAQYLDLVRERRRLLG